MPSRRAGRLSSRPTGPCATPSTHSVARAMPRGPRDRRWLRRPGRRTLSPSAYPDASALKPRRFLAACASSITGVIRAVNGHRQSGLHRRLSRPRQRREARSPRRLCQEVHSRVRRFATRANACADRRRKSAPSRAGTFTWRAAGLLLRQRCGLVRAADPPSATRPLSATAGPARSLRTVIAGGLRCIAT